MSLKVVEPIEHLDLERRNSVDGDYGLEWLFDVDRMDHLSIEDQLKLYKTRDLRRSKLLRFGIGFFHKPATRTRRIIAPPMVFKDEPPPDVTSFTGHSTQSPAKHLTTVTNTETVAESKEEKLRCYRQWLEQRRKLRKSLDSVGLVDQWLARKQDKTDLERRVLRRILEEKCQKIPQQIGPATESTGQQYKLPQFLPTIQRPSPHAVKVIERFLYERQIRLIDLFQEVDKNKDWMVTSDEFRQAIQQSGMSLSDADIDDLIVVYDENSTGQLDYRHLALSLKLWRKEKKEAKKIRQQRAVSAATADEFGCLMGFTTLPGQVSQSLPASPMVTSQDECRVSPNSFTVIGADPRPRPWQRSTSESILVNRTDSNSLSTAILQEDGMQDLTKEIGDKSRQQESSMSATQKTVSRGQSPCQGSGKTAMTNESFSESHSNILLQPPQVDLRDESLVLSSVEEMMDVRHRNQHLLRLQNLQQSKRKKVDETSEIAVIRCGDVDIDNHCAPSSLAGELADSVNNYRQRQLRTYMDMCHICDQHGAVFTDKLLRAVLLHPGDRSHTAIRRNIRQPTGLLSAADYSRMALSPALVGNSHLRASSKHRHLSSDDRQSQNSSQTTSRSTGVTGVTGAAGVTGVSGLLEDDYSSLSSDATSDSLASNCVPVSRIYRRQSKVRPKQTLMKLSTGSAMIGRKVDCWLSFEDYLHFTRNLATSSHSALRLRPDDNAVWPNRLLDKLRLVLPPGASDNNYSGSSIFYNTSNMRSQSSGRFCTGLRAWPINQSGYVQYGSIS